MAIALVLYMDFKILPEGPGRGREEQTVNSQIQPLDLFPGGQLGLRERERERVVILSLFNNGNNSLL
jgi:hypothetical protein